VKNNTSIFKTQNNKSLSSTYFTGVLKKTEYCNIAPACYPLAIQSLHLISGLQYFLSKAKKPKRC